jgi:hypothetical protein
MFYSIPCVDALVTVLENEIIRLIEPAQRPLTSSDHATWSKHFCKRSLSGSRVFACLCALVRACRDTKKHTTIIRPSNVTTETISVELSEIPFVFAFRLLHTVHVRLQQRHYENAAVALRDQEF